MLRSLITKSPKPLSSAKPLLFFSTKTNKTSKTVQKTPKKGSKPDPKDNNQNPSLSSSSSGGAVADDLEDKELRVRRLAEDEKNKSLDVGPNGRPLFTERESLSLLSRHDTCSYINFSMDDLRTMLPEGLPAGMLKEFEDSKRNALLIRQSFLDLRDNFRRIVDPPLQSSDGKGTKVKKQIVLDGPVSCGKSIALAMLVQWAREEGWLVFYVPQGRNWTHGGFFYHNPKTGFWDTPVQATNALQDFLKFNESRLQHIRCQITDSILLGEGAGVGWMKGVDSMEIPEGSTIYDLVQIGIRSTNAAVGVLVRLRKELSLVKDVPVLFAIDQFNNWFTHTEFEEPETVRSCKPIHARDVATVNAFRSMLHNDMMVGAFSHSTAVGKLRQDLPDVPVDARTNLSRYTLDEAAAVCHYYLRQRLVRREAFSDEGWKKIYFLANGNGAEMRWLFPFMR